MNLQTFEKLPPRFSAAYYVLTGEKGLREAAREHDIDAGGLSRFVSTIKREVSDRREYAEAQAEFYEWVENLPQ